MESKSQNKPETWDKEKSLESQLVSVTTVYYDKHLFRHYGEFVQHKTTRTRTLRTDTNVYSTSNLGDNYQKKTVGELEEGDNVSWDTDRIDAMLADIVDSPDYALAKSQLFVDVGGRTVPRLQYELLKASAQARLIKGNLDERLEEDRIPNSEITAAAKYIHGEYERLCSEDGLRIRDIKKLPIKQWLNGTTVAPKKFDDLLYVAVALNHEPLMDMYDSGVNSPYDINGFWGANKFYHSARTSRGKFTGKMDNFSEKIVDVKPLDSKLIDVKLGLTSEDTRYSYPYRSHSRSIGDDPLT